LSISSGMCATGDHCAPQRAHRTNRGRIRAASGTSYAAEQLGQTIRIGDYLRRTGDTNNA
jgi:hypothetical protein